MMTNWLEEILNLVLQGVSQSLTMRDQGETSGEGCVLPVKRPVLTTVRDMLT